MYVWLWEWEHTQDSLEALPVGWSGVGTSRLSQQVPRDDVFMAVTVFGSFG